MFKGREAQTAAWLTCDVEQFREEAVPEGTDLGAEAAIRTQGLCVELDILLLGQGVLGPGCFILRGICGAPALGGREGGWEGGHGRECPRESGPEFFT